MSGGTPQVTNASAFRHRSLGKMVVFFIITFSFYGLYWMHQVNKQVAAGTDENFSPLLRTIGLLIPLLNLYFIWKFSMSSEAVVDQSGVLMFLLWLVFPPAAWYLTSTGINDVAAGAA